MADTVFYKIIIGGGWAMVLLIPASIVALATVLRAMAVRRAGDDDGGQRQATGLAEPLLWIYAAAPLVGAAGGATKILGASPGSSSAALIPMLWALAIALFSIVFYAILQRPGQGRGKLLLLFVPGLVALVCAGALCLVAGDTRPPAGEREPVLSMRALSGAAAAQSPDTPTLQVVPDGYALNGQPVSDTDVVFRLTGLAARSQVIIVKADGNLPAGRLATALALVNQAGFLHVGVDTSPE